MRDNKRGVLVWDLGLCDYGKAYERQKALLEKKRQNSSLLDTLFLVEHPEVYTYGRKSPPVPLDPSLPSVEVERGGEMTYHNPGQLVAYPILWLDESERDLHLHLRRLENSVISVLGDFGIPSEARVGATGVWVKGKEKKIASVGIAVSGWITYHGAALNVTNDLIGFHRIQPCGFSPEVMTSMEKEIVGKPVPPMEAVKARFIEYFIHHFNRCLVV